jgi:hypothetical protein
VDVIYQPKDKWISAEVIDMKVIDMKVDTPPGDLAEGRYSI